jgi:hypothetical protein
LPEPDGTEHREELTLADLEVDAVDGHHVAEPLDHALERDRRSPPAGWCA